MKEEERFEHEMEERMKNKEYYTCPHVQPQEVQPQSDTKDGEETIEMGQQKEKEKGLAQMLCIIIML